MNVISTARTLPFALFLYYVWNEMLWNIFLIMGRIYTAEHVFFFPLHSVTNFLSGIVFSAGIIYLFPLLNPRLIPHLSLLNKFPPSGEIYKKWNNIYFKCFCKCIYQYIFFGIRCWQEFMLPVPTSVCEWSWGSRITTDFTDGRSSSSAEVNILKIPSTI